MYYGRTTNKVYRYRNYLVELMYEILHHGLKEKPRLEELGIWRFMMRWMVGQKNHVGK
jgi:hypothetical protein